MFRFYQDLIRLRLDRPALRSRNIDVVYVHDHRIIAFRRWEGPQEFFVIGSLNDASFGDGYTFAIPGSSAGTGVKRSTVMTRITEVAGC